MHRFLHALSTISALLAGAVAQTVPAGFTVDMLAQSGLHKPIDFTFLPDGRALIAGKTGNLYLFANAGVHPVGAVPNVDATGLGEKGLLSIEVDPNFVANGYLYVLYCSTQDAFLHVDRFELVGSRNAPTSVSLTIDGSSRRTVLNSLPDVAPSHNGGTLRFGPDGKLLVSAGDDEDGCAAQSPTGGAGALYRLDVSALPPGGSATAPSYAMLDPGDNPLSSLGGLGSLVLAIGFRNPFRFVVDPVTGNVYIGDVGGDLFEEIDEYVYQPGNLPLRNYGWPWFEGTLAHTPNCGSPVPNGLEPPIVAASHMAAWMALIQGPRYRNQGGIHDFGPAYEGSLFAADHYGAFIRRWVPTGNGWLPAPPVLGQPSTANWATQCYSVTAMRVGPDGALYMTHDVPWWAGLFTRVRPSNPVASLGVHAGGGQVVPAREPFPQPVVVRVANSQGSPLAGVPVTFAANGPVTLTSAATVVTDAQGLATCDVAAVDAGGAGSVAATAVGASGAATVPLFVRKISVTVTPTTATVDIANTTQAIPAQVSFVVLAGLPTVPTWLSPLGPICTDPASVLTIVLEDGFGVRGFFSLSGQGGVGTPALSRTYPLIPGLLNGMVLKFQAIGWDPVTGLFRTDCSTAAF